MESSVYVIFDDAGQIIKNMSDIPKTIKVDLTISLRFVEEWKVNICRRLKDFRRKEIGAAT